MKKTSTPAPLDNHLSHRRRLDLDGPLSRRLARTFSALVTVAAVAVAAL